jgi:hypothetical protein
MPVALLKNVQIFFQPRLYGQISYSTSKKALENLGREPAIISRAGVAIRKRIEPKENLKPAGKDVRRLQGVVFR